MKIPYCGSNLNVNVALLWIGVGTKLANNGYAVFGIDYEGHGHSGGARCYIKKFDNIVNDCSDFFKSVCGKLPNAFLFTSSLTLTIIS